EEGEVNPYVALASRACVAGNPYEPPLEIGEDHPERGWLQRTLDILAPLRDAPQQAQEFAVDDMQAEQDWEERHHPARGLAAVPLDLVGLSESVEQEVAAYFGGPLRNVGYWRAEGLSPQRACEQLVAEVLALLPEGARDNPGKVLVLGPNAAAVVDHVRVLRPAAVLTAGRDSGAAIKSVENEGGAAEAVYDTVV